MPPIYFCKILKLSLLSLQPLKYLGTQIFGVQVICCVMEEELFLSATSLRGDM